MPDTPDFTDQFNTPLSSDKEAAFQKWAKANNKLGDLYDYDLRGAFIDKLQPAVNGHLPDTYKKPNHPTFSDQSIYHGTLDSNGVPYIGGVWGPNNSFTPSTQMLLSTISPMNIKNYFAQREPNSQLILPWWAK